MPEREQRIDRDAGGASSGWSQKKGAALDAGIVLILGQDGVSSGAIYALLALALVLIFSVTRVIFIPQGEFVAFGALTLAMLQAGKVPATVWLLVAMGAVVAVVDGLARLRDRDTEGLGGLLGWNLAYPLALAALLHAVEPGGLPMVLQIALTLAILDGMSVKVADEVFILPLNAVMESLQPREEDLHPLAGGERVLEVRGEYLPLVELWKVFEVDGAKTEATQGIVVILQSAGRRYALLVDQLIGQHQVVVKNLESNYRKVPGISAATILGDGSVALIVDVSALQGLNREQRVAYTAA